MNRKFKAGLASVALAAGLTVGAASPAFADSMSTDNYVTASAYRAAMPLPEILGLSNVQECTTWLDISSLPDSLLTWTSPKYNLFGTTTYNENPNPFFYNYLYDQDGNSTKVIFSAFTGSPNTALPTYDSSNERQKAIWDMLPDVIIGASGVESYDTDEYAGAAAAANGVEDYHPATVEYSLSSYATLTDTVYKTAAAADEAAESTGKTLRYGNATAIAKDYEEYILGTQGYILKQLAASGAEQKSVALIKNYDESAGTYTVEKIGIAEGTATANRYLETVQSVATNLGDTVGTTLTAEQLANADLILIGGQGGSSSNELYSTLSPELAAKTFFIEDSEGCTGSLYGTTMNSVENAQNIGRILGCLYPEYVDQDNWVCYYYDNFYHINADKLADAIDNAMDGVRNWDSTGDATSWTTADAADYVEADVQLKIDEGIAWLKQAGTDAPAILDPSTNLDGTSIENGAAIVADIPEVDITSGAAEPDPVVTVGDKTLVKNVDYFVEYSNNTETGEATMTITGIGDYEGTITKTFQVKVVADIANATVADIPVAQIERGAAAEPSPVVTVGDKTLVLGTDYTVTYANNTAAGDATMTITGAGDYTGTITKTFKVEVLDVAATRLMGDSDAYQTAIAISKQTFEDGSSPYVLIARDDDFADAMSATGLAGALSAPILMADRETGLAAETLAEITRLGATKVYIVGGTGALTGDIEGQLPAGVTSERINGETAADTSVVAAAKLAEVNAADGVTGAYAVVAMSDNFQDALSMSSFAYAHRAPIVLETSGATAADRALTTEAEALFADGGAYDGVQVFVAGGTGALSNESLACFDDETVERLFGTTGYDTSNQIATTLTAKGLLSASTVAVACGAEAANGSDALAGAALAGKAGGVMLLVNDNIAMENSNTVTLTGVDSQDTAAFLTANASSVEKAYILGGTFVVPSTLETQVNSIING